MAADVWVLVERQGNELHEVTLEMLGEGRKLATKLGVSVCAVLMGEGVSEQAETLAHYGAQKVYLLEHALLAHYTTDAYASVLTDLIKEHKPEIVMLAGTPNGNDLAPRVAARLKVGLASNCVILKIDDQGALQMIRPNYGDKVYTTMTCAKAAPKIATIRPGAIGVDKPKKNRKAEVIPVEVTINSADIRTTVVGFIKADPATVDLKEADILIAGGRGVGGPQQWPIIEELASALGGSVGATRLALDLGCAPEERLVGVTGRTTNPQLYIGAGISGASQHVAGMSNAKLIIAINKDKGAPILKLADMGIVGDLHLVIPKLTKRILELKASAEGGSQG